MDQYSPAPPVGDVHYCYRCGKLLVCNSPRVEIFISIESFDLTDGTHIVPNMRFCKECGERAVRELENTQREFSSK